MKNLKKLFLMSILAVSSFVLSGVANVEAAEVFSLKNTDVVCDPAKLEKGKQATCYIVGVPSESGTLHGYVVKAYTTKYLKLAGVSGVVTNTSQSFATASSATKNSFTAKEDMPEEVKALQCEYDGASLTNIQTTSFGCAVFYTVKNASTNAFSPAAITSSATKGKVNASIFANATYGVIGGITVKLDENVTGNECGEICVKVHRVPTKANYADYLTCGNDPSTGCGRDTAATGNSYDCKEIHYNVSGTDPETGAFASYALLAACAFIAVSAITLAKKNNKFSRI